jgi:hypothetical protein
MDVGLNRSSLQDMEKDNKDSIREYTYRWCETVAQANPPLLEKGDDQFICQHFQSTIL